MADSDKRGKISDAEKILDRIIGDDPELRAHIEEQRLDVRIAEMI